MTKPPSNTYLCHNCRYLRHARCRPVSPSGKKRCRCRCRIIHRNIGPRDNNPNWNGPKATA